MAATAHLVRTQPRPPHAPGAAAPDAATIAEMLVRIARARDGASSDLERLPERLSPSRAADFKNCPQSFYLKTLVHLASPPTEATARGTIAHTAFERTFNHPSGERTPTLAKTYVRPAWEELVNPDDHDGTPKGVARAAERATAYRALAPANSPAEHNILTFAELMVDNWFTMERITNFNPALVTLPSGAHIDGRELQVGADLFGVHLHGIVDRLDSWPTANGLAYSISDYKTGKVPGAGKSYSPQVTARIFWDSFLQLRIYALLVWELYQIRVQVLRLVYVATADREHGIKTLHMSQDVIDRTRAEVSALWSSIRRAATNEVWTPRTGPLCAWCWYLDVCPAFDNPVG